MAAHLYLDALPHNTTKGTLVRLLIQVGDLDKQRIGTIEITGRRATIEVPEAWVTRLVKALDGTTLGHQHIRAWGGAAASTSGNAEEHFAALLKWIDIEAAAEAQMSRARLQRMTPAEAERTGASLVNLVIRDETTGLGSRVLVTLAKRDQTVKLPWTRLGVGSPVLLAEENVKDGESLRGIVSQRESQTIEVVLARWPEPQGERPTFRIDLSSDEVARDRQRFALQRSQAAQHERLAELREVLLGEKGPRFLPAEARSKAALEFSSPLNTSQQAAIQFALSAEDLAIIHGPPGTGKTTTVVELIQQAVLRGDRVLACAPSNLAVDNLLERLLKLGVNALRLGHPARVLPELREHTLDLMVENHPDLKVARKLVKEANQLRQQASRYTRAKPEPGAKNQLRAEAKQLELDAARIERQVVAYLLDTTRVLCATLTGLDTEVLGTRQFDLAVIDEACQSTEPACWIPLLRAQRVVLAGDHFQLPPTVVSHDAQRGGFGVSLLERLIQQFGAQQVSRRLTEQYRMHQAIMDFSSLEFYDGELVAAPGVEARLLCELPEVERSPLTETPLEFVDTAGAGYDEELEPDGESRRNVEEANVAVRKVEALLAAGVPANEVAVIAPYAAQVRLLREKLGERGVEVDTVDGFQGREKEAIIITLVRSNSTGEIGFLADERRMNVALTRAKRKLIVIGDSATVGAHEFYERMLKYFEALGAYKTVWEEPV